MANLGTKNGTFIIRFRFGGKEYKRSLKTRSSPDAAAAKNSVELTVHRILTGFLTIPSGVDPGDFILSGGVLLEIPPHRGPTPPLPTTQALIDEYLRCQKNLLAESYHYSQEMHLRHFSRFLNGLANTPCDQIGQKDLERFLHERLAIRDPATVARERVTLTQFYKWVCSQEATSGYPSPASRLFTIKFGRDRDPFRTMDEIEQTIQRGGLSEEEGLAVWECLYLNPQEIGSLLKTVQANAADPISFILHAIPAYTGMRRGEVLRLTWLDVDIINGYVTARSRKQSRSRTETIRRIDLHAELKPHLLDWRTKRPKGQFVIADLKTLEPISKDLANRSFWQPLRGTDWNLEGGRNWFKVGFHTYRHSFASNLAAAGVDQRIIDEFMGHQTEAMRKRYRHLFPKNRRAAIESFSLAGPTAKPEL
jgi:integrase